MLCCVYKRPYISRLAIFSADGFDNSDANSKVSREWVEHNQKPVHCQQDKRSTAWGVMFAGYTVWGKTAGMYCLIVFMHLEVVDENQHQFEYLEVIWLAVSWAGFCTDWYLAADHCFLIYLNLTVGLMTSWDSDLNSHAYKKKLYVHPLQEHRSLSAMILL